LEKKKGERGTVVERGEPSTSRREIMGKRKKREYRDLGLAKGKEGGGGRLACRKNKASVGRQAGLDVVGGEKGKEAGSPGKLEGKEGKRKKKVHFISWLRPIAECLRRLR